MKSFLLLIVLTASLYAVVHSAALDPYQGRDFYKEFNDPEAHLSLQPPKTTIERIVAHGYPAEQHYVVTKDGYIVTLFRIPYSHKLQNQNVLRPIVIVQHGLFSSSDAWLLSGPDNALPFLLADAGYDVWLGNARGNTYSRKHSTLSITHPYFWHFSWHEIGHYDIAAMIDYALATNGQGQTAVHYVGHSQGTTVFFVLLSTRPEYNDKIKTAHMLAPVAFMSNMRSSLVRTLAPYLGHYNMYSKLFCCQEFLPYNDFVLAMLYNTCNPDSRYASHCDGVLYNSSSERKNATALADTFSTHPAGVSTNQILHYMQGQQQAHFREFDHGTKKNIKTYKSEVPTDYPVELITAQMHLWYSDNDAMAAVEDVLHIADLLPNKIMHHMEDPLWDHFDFAANIEVRKYINEPVIEIMDEYEQINKL